MKLLKSLLFLLPLLISAFASHYVSLEDYQTSSGGFRPTFTQSESIEATHYGLFLSSLFGQGKKINSEQVANFIQTLENDDGGYGKSAGQFSDLESTWHAVLSFQNLGTQFPNQEKVVTFINSLFDKDLFSNRLGNNGDLKSTVLAFQSLNILKEENFLKEITPKLREYLNRIEKSESGKTFFATSDLSPLASNYYGTLLADLVEYKLSDFFKRVEFIASHQSPSGGFFSNEEKTVTLESTVQAILTLSILQKYTQDDLFSKINIDGVENYISSVPNDLKSIAFKHMITSILDPTSEFETTISYDGVPQRGVSKDSIVQGTSVKPALSIKSRGVPHSGFSVSVEISVEGSEKKTLPLTWSDSAQKYISEQPFVTEDILGTVTFDYSATLSISDIDEVSFSLRDSKKVGYGITISSEANFAGENVKEGETIGVGTSFNFDVTLFTQTKGEFDKGDFDVVFQILDSSHTSLVSQTINGRKNEKPITFSYVLERKNIPAGLITALFEVKDKKGVHSSKKVQYYFSVPMVASEIKFEGVSKAAPTFRIGDTVKVSFVPGSFPDYRTVHPYSEPRNFLLDIKSPGGVLLQTLEPSTKQEKQRVVYTYSLKINPTLDFLGTNALHFRYVPKSGDDIVLSNYDSSLEELIDTQLVNFTVESDLQIFNIQERPQQEDFFYGNEVSFKFQVKDNLSGKTILTGQQESANVYLILQHEMAGKAKLFTSTTQPATLYTNSLGEKEGFSIKWAINPNAVSGAGILRLIAQDVDGNTIPLKEGTKGEYKLTVKIGGTIDVKSQTFVSTKEGPETVLVVAFSLYCQERNLRNAQLQAVVTSNNERFAILPVSSSEDGYQVSWTTPHQNLPAGDYKIQFYRESDRVDKKDAKPLFQIDFYHEGVTASLPIRTEFFVIIILGAAFFALSTKKTKYTK